MLTQERRTDIPVVGACSDCGAVVQRRIACCRWDDPFNRRTLRALLECLSATTGVRGRVLRVEHAAGVFLPDSVTIRRFRYLLFRHSHVGTDCESAQRPFLASRASRASPSSTVSPHIFDTTSATDKRRAFRSLSVYHYIYTAGPRKVKVGPCSAGGGITRSATSPTS